MALELVANVWPVVDEGTGLVLRYYMRAYAVDAPDEVISETLRALAPTDFRLARMFRIPKRFAVVSEHGQLDACVSIGDFRRYQEEILTPALAQLEEESAKLQGIRANPATGEVVGASVIPRFPTEPYLVVTALLETPDGELVPQVSR